MFILSLAFIVGLQLVLYGDVFPYAGVGFVLGFLIASIVDAVRNSNDWKIAFEE